MPYSQSRLSQSLRVNATLVICGVRAQKSTKLANSHCDQNGDQFAHLSARLAALCDCAKLSLRYFDKRSRIYHSSAPVERPDACINLLREHEATLDRERTGSILGIRHVDLLIFLKSFQSFRF